MSHQKYHYEVPLTALTLKDNLQFFHDEKTKELYSYFPGKEEPELEDESLLREAEEKTTLNSHFSASKYKSFRNNIEQNVVMKGVTLRENSNSIDFNRNRSYSIVNATKQRKRAITTEDYEKLQKDNGVVKEIVYSYAGLEDGSLPEVVQSRYIPQQSRDIPKQPRDIQMQSRETAQWLNDLPKEKDHSLKSSRNDMRSLLSTRYNPNLSQHNTIPIRVREKAKAYKFVKMQKKAPGAQQTRLNCNLFSFLDSTLNKPDPSSSKLPPAKMDPIAKPIKLKPWK